MITLSSFAATCRRAAWGSAAFVFAALAAQGLARAEDAPAEPFQIFDNYSSAQKPLSSRIVARLSDCADLCQDNEACKSFNYNKASHACFLGSAATSMGFDPSVATGARAGGEIPATSDAPFYLDCVGNQAPDDAPTATTQSVTFEACSQGCMNEESCAVFSYGTADKSCHYFGTLSGLKPTAAAMMGFKHQLPPGAKHEAKECKAYESASGDARAAKGDGENRVISSYQHCVFDTFKKKLARTTTANPDLAHDAAAECEPLLEPVRNGIRTKTGSAAFADRMIVKIQLATLRDLTVGLFASYFPRDPKNPAAKP